MRPRKQELEEQILSASAEDFPLEFGPADSDAVEAICADLADRGLIYDCFPHGDGTIHVFANKDPE